MKKALGLLIIGVISLRLIFPLFSSGYFPMHDDAQVARVVTMGKALRWGQFPVRWVSDLGYGYGYPIFNFYGPLPYYVGGLFYALGFSGLVATKIMMGMGMVLAGITMFLFSASALGVLPAIAASVLYVYAPYHAVQLYVRGAVGELWTLVFFPLVAWGFVRPDKRLLGGIGLAGVILSHTLLGYATTALIILGLIIYWFVRFLQRRFSKSFIMHHISFIGIGLGLSTFFWLPAVTEMGFTSVAKEVSKTANFRDHFVCLSQLWSSQWGFGGSAKGCIDGISFMVGKLHILVGIVALLAYKRSVVLGVSLATSIVGAFLVSRWSLPVWEALPGFTYLQYPWRFIVYIVFGLSLSAGLCVSRISGKLMRSIVALVLVAGAYGLYAKWFTPNYLYARPAAEFETPEELRMRVSKISDEYLPKDFVRPLQEQEYVHDTIVTSPTKNVRTIVETDTYSRFDITASEEGPVEVKRAFFPGLVFWVNGKQQTPLIDKGIPTIVIPKGENVMEMRFTNTPIRTMSNFISFVTALGLLVYYGKKNNT